MLKTTELCIDLKTFLRRDARMQPGRNYLGVLRRDMTSDENGFDDSHYTFVETEGTTHVTRNPRVYIGQYINITQRKDGSIRPNFKQKDFTDLNDFIRFARGVYDELTEAAVGLIEKGTAPE